jgi:hypothetical protein
MKRIFSLVVSALVLLTISTSLAEDKSDPAAQAKFIAPYIDEQTFLIVRVDVAKVKIDAVVDALCRLMPDEKEDILQSKILLQQIMDSYIKAGGKELYVGIRADVRDAVLLVVPAGDKFDHHAIENNPIFKPLFKDFSFKRVDGAFLGAVANRRAGDRPDDIKPDPRPELAAAFESAGDSAIQVLLVPPVYFRRVIEETMPRLPREIGGGSSEPLSKGLSWAALSIGFTPQMTARLVIQSPDASSASALGVLIADVLKNVANLPALKQQFPAFADFIPNLTPKSEGDKLVLNIDERNAELGNLLGKVQTAFVSEARDNARRAQSINNMKQIGLAMHNYHDANKHFPAAAIYSKDGKPLLSWRVALLPMMEYGNMYDQFHLDEPWDSEHNKQFIAKMPGEYRSPKSKLKEPGKTNYVVPVGPGTVFEGREGMLAKQITDGMSHTIMAVEVDDAHAVTWTKPDDLPYNPNDPSKGLGGVFNNVFIALFCDGAVRTINLPCPDEKLRAAFSAAAGDPAPNFN